MGMEDLVGKRSGAIRIYQSSINVWEEKCVGNGQLQDVFSVAMRLLRTRGWKLRQDSLSNYKPFRSSSRDGVCCTKERRGLEFHARTLGRHLEIEFFQNLVNVDNSNGGRYCFGKLQRMPRMLRCATLAEMWHLAQLFGSMGYRLTVGNGFQERGVDLTIKSVRNLAEHDPDETALSNFNDRWGSTRFELDATGWPSEKEYVTSYSARDRDGLPIRNGMTKFIRRNGRLMRVVAYTNMNDMWRCDVNGTAIAYVGGRDLFDCDDPKPGRVFTNQAFRLEQELARAVKARAFSRVAAIGSVLSRTAA